MTELLAGFIGVLFGILFIYALSIDPLLDECQKEMPRDQICILTAIPEATKND